MSSAKKKSPGSNNSQKKKKPTSPGSGNKKASKQPQLEIQSDSHLTTPIKTKKTSRQKKYNDPYAEARDDKSLTLIEHLNEIRSRLLVIIIIIIALTIIAFGIFSQDLYDAITYPLKNINIPSVKSIQLHGFTVIAGFMARLKISLLVAFLITMPFIIFHLWRFILPAVAKHNRAFSRNAIISSLLLFYTGIAFVYFVMLPMGLPVLLEFFFKDLQITIGIDSYISTLLTFCFGMGLVFQLPIIIMILTKIGLITPQFLVKYRRHSIVVIWLVAAIVTPQDIWTQVLVAIPLMFLYEISILLSKFILKRAQKREVSTQN